MIWKVKPNLDVMNQMHEGNMVAHVGIVYTEFGDDYLIAKMPVDKRTKQPFGLLHGGASCVLSESMGSTAATLVLDNPMEQQIVGVEINANHLKSAKSGYVYGKTRPIKIGRRLQVWETEIRDEGGKLICVSRLTVMVISK